MFIDLFSLTLLGTLFGASLDEEDDAVGDKGSYVVQGGGVLERKRWGWGEVSIIGVGHSVRFLIVRS